MLRFIPRNKLNLTAWDACVAASPGRILYGYSWYLDAVLPAPAWQWVGLVWFGEAGTYQAVMPVPLRRKQLAGITGAWVVHQPLFCQFLDVFSQDRSVDPALFLRAVCRRFRYGSVLRMRELPIKSVYFNLVQPLNTHVLDLSADYPTLYGRYTRDRRLNLRRAEAGGWRLVDSDDPEPLLKLFRANHAAGIPGGVADWAYILFRNLVVVLTERGLVSLRYALRADGCPEAGVLFVREGNRIIYLFNAASESGRRGNARTLLIDRMIRENAGSRYAGQPVWLDFESPVQPSIVAFYQSFGAVDEPFWTVRWNRLNRLEQTLLWLHRRLKKAAAND